MKEEITEEQAKARQQLRQLFFRPRGSGRTTQLMDALYVARNPVICVVRFEESRFDFAKQVDNDRVKFITLRQLDVLRTDDSPVVIDHSVMEELLRKAF